jgi:hypothetical protein
VSRLGIHDGCPLYKADTFCCGVLASSSAVLHLMVVLRLLDARYKKKIEALERNTMLSIYSKVNRIQYVDRNSLRRSSSFTI